MWDGSSPVNVVLSPFSSLHSEAFVELAQLMDLDQILLSCIEHIVFKKLSERSPVPEEWTSSFFRREANQAAQRLQMLESGVPVVPQPQVEHAHERIGKTC